MNRRGWYRRPRVATLSRQVRLGAENLERKTAAVITRTKAKSEVIHLPGSVQPSSSHENDTRTYSDATDHLKGSIIEYETARFSKVAVPTEATAYRLLKTQPVGGQNYFAVPWCDLLKEKRLKMRSVRRELQQLRAAGGFTICQHINFRKILSVCARMGIDTVFTPHAVHRSHGVNQIFSASPWRGAGFFRRPIRVLPFPHFSVNGAEPGIKDLLYSFVGSSTHPCREPLFQLRARQDAVVRLRECWHFALDDEKRQRATQEYRDLLSRSRFSLCPRGTGPSTIRFWESLQAGAIPVVISDDFRLPDNFRWESCVVRIAESDVSNVESILESIHCQQEARLRANGLRAYAYFSESNFVSCIRDHYDSDSSVSRCAASEGFIERAAA